MQTSINEEEQDEIYKRLRVAGELLVLTSVKEGSWMDVTEGDVYPVIFSKWHNDFVFRDGLGNIQKASDYNWRSL